MRITFLSDNKTENAACNAEWGFSVLIESGGRKVLFDVGASPMFAENARAIGVELADVEAVAVSHGHYDHTEGMEAFCELNKTAPIYIHRDALNADYALDEQGNMEDVNCGLRWSEEFRKSVEPRLVLTEGVVKMNETMTLVGNVPLLSEYPMTERFFHRLPSGSFEEDPMDHEQFLVVKEEKGIYVFSGCSHKGVMSIIARVQELFPQEKICALIAGMHLYPLPAAEQQKIVDAICDLGVEYIFPVHCTGMRAIMAFRCRLGEKCVIASAGESYDC